MALGTGEQEHVHDPALRGGHACREGVGKPPAKWGGDLAEGYGHAVDGCLPVYRLGKPHVAKSGLWSLAGPPRSRVRKCSGTPGIVGAGEDCRGLRETDSPREGRTNGYRGFALSPGCSRGR